MARRIIQFNILAFTALIATFFPGSQVLAQETYSEKARILADIAAQYAAIGQSQQAVKILDQALPLTKATTNECFKGTPLVKLAGGYTLAGQEAKGKQLLVEAVEVARTQTATGCHVSATSPEESLLNRAKEYARAGYYDFALQIITQVGANNIFTPIALAEVAGYYAKAGETGQATKVLNQAVEMAERNPSPYRTMTLLGIASHLIQAGQTERVPQVLERALESASAIDEAKSGENAAMKLNQMTRTARLFAEVGEERRAIELLDQALPKIRTLADKRFPADKIIQMTEAATLYAKLQQNNKAVEMLAEARTEAQAIDEDLRKSYALARIAIAYAELGNFEQAQQIARSIKSVNEREQAFSGIAIAYAKAGDADQAVKLAKSIGNQNGTLMEIVRHYVTSKKYDQALDIVQKQNVKGIILEVVLAYAEAGQPERALQIVKSIPSPPDGSKQSEWILPPIAREFAKQGKLDQAVQVAQTITNKSYKAQTLTAIVEEYVARERDKSPIANILSELSDRFNSLFGSSDQEKATEILDQALQVAQSMTPKQ